MKNIAILASGNGTNAENIAGIFNSGTVARVALVLTNRAKAGVIARMEKLGVPVEFVPNVVWDNEPQEVVEILRRHNIDLVVLAGFMHYVSPVIIKAYENRIVNIHPSLLPKYGGKGMYGHHVHEAVIAAGESESGVTVHYVTEEMDGGDILMQERVVITPEDTAESLEAKIHPVEYNLYPRAIMAALGKIPATAPSVSDPQPPHYTTPLPQNPPVMQPLPKIQPAPQMQTPPQMQAPQMQMPSQMEEPERPPMPDNYLVWAILATVLCCLPLGVVAIIMSGRVNSRYTAGDYEGAKKASEQTQLFIILSFVLGLVGMVAFLPLSL